MKLWYFVSLLFFILSLFTLIEDRYEVTYESKNKTKSEFFDYLICTPLKKIEIYSNRSEIDLNQLKNELYEYLNESKSLIQSDQKDKYENLILNRVKGNNYLIKKDHFCFSKIKEIDKINFRYVRFIFKNLRYFVINWDIFYIGETEFLLSYDILIVLNKAYLHSNCTENYFRFKCLNTCFKGKNKLSKYWYSGNETGIIKLNYDKNNQTLKKSEDECFKECERKDCTLVYILPIKKNSNYFKLIEARPLISPFDYWAQLIGLFVLFFNICFYQIYTQFMNKINFKLKKPKHQRYVTISKHITLILFGLSFLTSLITKIIEYENQRSDPIRRVTTFRSIEPNSFSIVLCMRTNNFGRKFTLSTIEQKTSKLLNKSFKGIYLEFENKRKLVDFTLKPKVFFFKYFYRCFQLVPHLKEIRYQNLFTASKLIVEFKHRNDRYYYEYYILYLIPDDQNFNSKSYQNSLFFNFIKKITKRSKLKYCVDYRELNSNFRNRWDSFDRCINRKYINRTGKIYFYSKIDRDYFTDDEWKRSYFDQNETAHNEIREECRKEIKGKDCNEIEIEKDHKITSPDDPCIMEIDLYIQVDKIADEDQSIYKVLLDILNILSILYGLSITQLLHMIYLLAKIKFKWCLLLIYLLCSFGLTYHIYYILNEVINEDLIYSQHYEVLESIKMTETIFCFEFNQTIIDKNYELTGNYLNEITNEMRADKVFDEISYLSESNEWVTLNSASNYTNNEFKVNIFFFVNKKCFKLKQEVEYGPKQLSFEYQKNKVLKIYFKLSFIFRDKRVTYLMSRVKDTMQFTKHDLGFKFNFRRLTSIYQEPFELTHNDKFNFIKNPLSLLYAENDVNYPDRYLKGLIDFKRGLSTLNLPIEEEAFNNEIDDDLFEQYYLQVQNITDHQKPTNSNYKRIFVNNYIDSNYDWESSKKYLSLHLIQFKKKLTITNSDNFTKLLLNLLNVFSIWFGLGVLDLHVYVHLLYHKIKSIIIFTYWRILDFERFILIRL